VPKFKTMIWIWTVFELRNGGVGKRHNVGIQDMGGLDLKEIETRWLKLVMTWERSVGFERIEVMDTNQ
jgi:hypothetical protein